MLSKYNLFLWENSRTSLVLDVEEIRSTRSKKCQRAKRFGIRYFKKTVGSV
jgi:hypothetical protein